jgi:hypothetical protein
MGEAVFKAKFYFAPLNAHADTDCMGWVACDEVMLGMQEQFTVRGHDLISVFLGIFRRRHGLDG